MAATRTGTAVQVNVSSASASANVLVPSDATGVQFDWTHWDASDRSMSTMTLGGVSITIAAQVANVGASPFDMGSGVGYLVNPATSTQSFAWTWTGAGDIDEGALMVLTFVKGIDTADPIRDAQAVGNAGTTATAITVSTQATDLLIALASRFADTVNGGPNFVLDGTVYIDNVTQLNHVYDASEVTPGAGSTTVNMTNENYSGMNGAAWKVDSGAAAVNRIRFPAEVSGMGVGGQLGGNRVN